MPTGIPIVLSAPSGCGKDTIIEQLLKINDNLSVSISATTRPMREGEADGVSYYFRTVSEFEDMIKNGDVLEYTRYCDNYYGTPRSAVEKLLSEGRDVILKIEVEGAMNIKKIFPDSVLIFVLPPSFTELERRLRKRGTESDEDIAARIKTARNEIEIADKFDYAVVNDELEKAVSDINAIILCEKMKTARNTDLIRSIRNS